ncbi:MULTISPECIES: hypothetical protein [Acinetobacter]|uniref:hypothetical protein n=1 Tax=Acinetobacter TaxID=469 RepID=UPI002DBF0A41|nr:hypothetical protein [Acinetobacter schindleri]MEB5928330.1 hypothetical protein [Acinetobacter schindleri]
MKYLGTFLICTTFLAITSVQAGNSYSPKTIPTGLQAVKNYIPNAIFWVSAKDDTEARYRALRYDELKYDLDEGDSHAYTVKLRLKPIDDTRLPVLECDAIINYYYKSKEVSELSNNIFGHYCEIY